MGWWRAVVAGLIAISANFFPLSANAQTPSQLRGKSVVAAWVEMRDQREGLEGPFRMTAVPQGLTVYVSTEGRLFTRRTAEHSRTKVQASRDTLASSGNTRIHDHTLVVTNKMAGGVRMMRIEFNSDFSSCNTSVIVGRESENAIARGTSYTTGRPLEIKSAKIGSTSCSVRDGNALAN